MFINKNALNNAEMELSDAEYDLWEAKCRLKDGLCTEEEVRIHELRVQRERGGVAAAKAFINK